MFLYAKLHNHGRATNRDDTATCDTHQDEEETRSSSRWWIGGMAAGRGSLHSLLQLLVSVYPGTI